MRSSSHGARLPLPGNATAGPGCYRYLQHGCWIRMQIRPICSPHARPCLTGGMFVRPFRHAVYARVLTVRTSVILQPTDEVVQFHFRPCDGGRIQIVVTTKFQALSFLLWFEPVLGELHPRTRVQLVAAHKWLSQSTCSTVLGPNVLASLSPSGFLEVLVSFHIRLSFFIHKLCGCVVSRCGPVGSTPTPHPL